MDKNKKLSNIKRMLKHALENVKNKPIEQIKIGKILERSLTINYDNLKDIKVPVLLLYGKDDEIFQQKSIEALHKEIPTSQVVLKEGNHSWSLLYYRQFCKEVLKWIGISGKHSL